MKKKFLYTCMLILALYGAKNLTIPKPYDIEVRFDSEGRNPVKSLIENSQALYRDPKTNAFRVKTGQKWLFIGDAMDHGEHAIRFIKAAIALKESDPNNVILIAGNRDLNKIPMYAETADDALDLQGDDRFALNKFRRPHWEKKFKQWLADKKNTINGELVSYQHGKNPESDRVLKLKWILECTKSAPRAFECFKKETGITDDYQATKAYREHCKKDGLFHRYLSLTQPIHIEEDTDTHTHPGTIFAHGGFCPENWGYVPLKEGGVVQFEMNNKSDLYSWNDLLAKVMQNSIQAGFNGDLPHGLLAVEYCEPKCVNNKEELNKQSVIQGVRPWGEPLTGDEEQRLADPATSAEEKETLLHQQRNVNNARPIHDAIAKQLKNWNITTGVFGHTPVQDLPLTIRRNGVTSFWGDLSYSKLKALTVLRICNGELTAKTPYQDGNKKTTVITHCTPHDPEIGAVTLNNDGRDVFNLGRTEEGRLLQQTFKKQPDGHIGGDYEHYQQPLEK